MVVFLKFNLLFSKNPASDFEWPIKKGNLLLVYYAAVDFTDLPSLVDDAVISVVRATAW
jgi:hypothetical protein